ncbi:hypothetical protein ACFYO1_15275 [Nocardia sp. NPDC006044]|uniref:hypothetical protein n=1 Tax=Nocardia sp. NPDC006044 TaxID=3364306 RepID=UPI0036A855D2
MTQPTVGVLRKRMVVAQSMTSALRWRMRVAAPVTGVVREGVAAVNVIPEVGRVVSREWVVDLV